MTGMELVMLFVVGWVVKSVWDDKAADHHANQRELVKRVNADHPNWDKDRRQRAVRNAKRRHTAGWIAYQLRHGWIPMITDIVDGYRAARIGHAEWIAQRPAEPQGWWQRCKQAWKAGWAGAKRAAAKKVRAATARFKDADPIEPPADTGPSPAAPPQPNPQPRPAPTGPHGGHTTSNNGGTVSGGETGGYAGAQQLTDGYNQSLAAAADQLEQYEADLIAGGLADDPASMATLAQMREGLETARAAVGGHKAALNSHEQGAEYAASKGAAAADTGWLGGGQ